MYIFIENHIVVLWVYFTTDKKMVFHSKLFIVLDKYIYNKSELFPLSAIAGSMAMIKKEPKLAEALVACS